MDRVPRPYLSIINVLYLLSARLIVYAGPIELPRSSPFWDHNGCSLFPSLLSGSQATFHVRPISVVAIYRRPLPDVHVSAYPQCE
jgi:hypothetical protein